MKLCITAKANNTRLHGRVTKGPSGHLTVELLRPYGHLSLVSSQDVHGETPDTKALTDDAQTKLNQLYRIALYVHNHRAILCDILKLVLRRIDLLNATGVNEQRIGQLRKRIRRDYDQGQIDERRYRDALDRVESRHREYGERMRREIERFFEKAFPMAVPEACWEQVLRMIKMENQGNVN